MKKTLLDFMEETQNEVLGIIDRRAEVTKPFVEVLKKTKFDKITMVSCGSSYNVAENVVYFMRGHLNVPVEVVSAFQFTHYDLKSASKNTLYICMSQSGRSTNVNTAARRLKELGYNTVALTDNAESPLKKWVKNIFEYGRTGDDDYVIKSFVLQSAFIMLSVCEYALAKQIMTQEVYDETITSITKAVKKLDDVRLAAAAFYKKNKALLQSMSRVIALGCGPTMGTVKEACLKMQETYACQATAFEIEEYFHGPSLCCNKDTTVFIVDEKNSAVHYRTRDAYHGLRCMTDRVIIITTDETIEGDQVIHIAQDHIPEDIGVLYFIIPFQYFCYILMEETQVSAIGREGKNCDKYYVIKEQVD